MLIALEACEKRHGVDNMDIDIQIWQQYLGCGPGKPMQIETGPGLTAA